jgi:glutathione S-transferase
MVVFEKASKAVLGLGAPDAAFVARGERNFARFAAVLDESLKERTWLTGQALTIADFSVGAIIPSAVRLGLSIDRYAEIGLWYARLASLPSWQFALARQEASSAAWRAGR